MKPQLKFISKIMGSKTPRKVADGQEKNESKAQAKGGLGPRVVTYESGTIKPTRSSNSMTDHSIDTRSHSPQTSDHETNIHEKYDVSPQVKGYGVAGQVRQAVNMETEEICAVKTITKAKTKRPDRIRREVAFLSQIDHPNIIRAHDVYEDEKYVHIVTDMCHGGELFDKILSRTKKRLGTQCFSESYASNIIRSLLSAVSYLHKQDIVHRDLKPENILFETEDEDSDIKLIDFGLSIRHGKDQQPLTNMVGTAYYMAPELLEGSYDRACDLWSVGVIAYILISGRPPFNGPNDEAIFKKVRRGDQVVFVGQAWTNVSDFAKHFIKCLICHDRSRRWTADMALQHPWLKIY